MIILLHGDHETKLQEAMRRQLEQARTEHADIVRLDGKKIEIADLERAIGTQTLFASKRCIVIERLFSLPKGKRKDALITWIREHDLQEVTILLLERKVLTPSQVKSFPGAQMFVYKYPAVLFTWVESIGTLPPSKALTLFHSVVERESAELAFVMLVRQIRTLLAFVADGVFDGPPFLRGKIASQAKRFTKEKLLVMYDKLLWIDELQKTSSSTMSLADNLDLFLVEDVGSMSAVY